MNKKFPICLLLGAILTTLLFSCNKNDEEGEVLLSNSVVITEFSLQPNEELLDNLDSVFFTIDLDKGLIYNADSLPKGTRISGLKVKMTHTACSASEFHVTGGTWMKDTVFAYKSEDSIDFTGDVKYTIHSVDLTNVKTYTIKVNVHQVDPDTLYWSEMARRSLPSYTTPLEQKTVQFNDAFYCLIKDLKGYVMSVTNDVAANRWQKNRKEFDFVPNISSFTATDDALYILDENNALYTSQDGLEWSECGTTMYSLIGAYGSTLLGITYDGNVYKHAQYPMKSDFVATEIPAGFPVSGMSQLVKVESRWAVSDQVVMIGGTLPNGECTQYVWGYDGTQWGIVNRDGIHIGYLTGVTLISYYAVYFDHDRMVGFTEPVLLAMGGSLSDGTVIKEVSMSNDKGLTWIPANDNLQLPEYIEPFYDAQAFVVNSTLTESRSSAGSDEWTMMQTSLPASMRVKSRATEAITSWECPYIYIFGGKGERVELYDNIWRGVINRLTFKPLY